MEQCLKNLLKKISKIRVSSGNSCNHNIFLTLKIEDKEVIICRFIGYLLNPYETHGLGTKPLELFFEKVLGVEISDDEAKKAVIILEESTNEKRRVDIAIHIKNRVYPIEVKIWAGDQHRQLSDYFKFYKDEQGNDIDKIYYLTPYGWEPSEDSKGKLEKKKIKTLSFSEDIKDWINDLVDLDDCDDYMEMNLNAFLEVIDKMSMYTNLEKILAEANNDELKSAAILLEKGKNIWRDIIVKTYLKNCINGQMQENGNYKEYEVVDCDESDKEIDGNCLLCIKKREEKIAWICVEENLYMCAKQNVADWGTYPDADDKSWKHIEKDNKTIKLKSPTKLPNFNGNEFTRILDELQ